MYDQIKEILRGGATSLLVYGIVAMHWDHCQRVALACTLRQLADKLDPLPRNPFRYQA